MPVGVISIYLLVPPLLQQGSSNNATKGLAAKKGANPATQLPSSYKLNLPRRAD
jgi:hypothetical protein